MIRLEFLSGKPEACFPVRQPEAAEAGGYFPASYWIQYDAARDTWRISLEDMNLRAAC